MQASQNILLMSMGILHQSLCMDTEGAFILFLNAKEMFEGLIQFHDFDISEHRRGFTSLLDDISLLDYGWFFIYYVNIWA